jgi:hypothetical protein
MTGSVDQAGGAARPAGQFGEADRRYVGFFHELDAWTEFWDIYHPETHGHFYFGDGAGEPGLLTLLLPRDRRPPVFVAWTRMALGQVSADTFAQAVRAPAVSVAVMELDALLARVFAAHFGDAGDPAVQADYLQGIHRFATDTLPPAAERDARIPEDDPRKSTAGRHTLAGDLMWFAWSLVLEAACVVAGIEGGHARHSLMLAGVASGCPADFAWHGHRRTRPEYRPDAATAALLRTRGLAWASDFTAAAREVHALFRIREWGSDS